MHGCAPSRRVSGRVSGLVSPARLSSRLAACLALCAGSALGLAAAPAHADDALVVGASATFVDPVVVGDPVDAFSVTSVDYLGAYDTLYATSFDLGYSEAWCPVYARPVFVQPVYCQPVTYYAPALVTYTTYSPYVYSVPSVYTYSSYSGYSSPFYSYSYTPYYVPSYVYSYSYSYYTPSYSFCAPRYSCDPWYGGYSGSYLSYGTYGSNFSFTFNYSSGGGWGGRSDCDWRDRWRERDCGWEWSRRDRWRDDDCVQVVRGRHTSGWNPDWRDDDRREARGTNGGQNRRERTYGRSQYGAITDAATPPVTREWGPSASGGGGAGSYGGGKSDRRSSTEFIGTPRDARPSAQLTDGRKPGSARPTPREGSGRGGQSGFGPAAPGEMITDAGAQPSNPLREELTGAIKPSAQPTPYATTRGGRIDRLATHDFKTRTTTITPAPTNGVPNSPPISRPAEKPYASGVGGVAPQMGTKPEEMKIGGVQPKLPKPYENSGNNRPTNLPPVRAQNGSVQPVPAGTLPPMSPMPSRPTIIEPTGPARDVTAPRVIRPTPRQPLKVITPSPSTGEVGGGPAAGLNGGRIEVVGRPSPAAGNSALTPAPGPTNPSIAPRPTPTPRGNDARVVQGQGQRQIVTADPARVGGSPSVPMPASRPNMDVQVRRAQGPQQPGLAPSGSPAPAPRSRAQSAPSTRSYGPGSQVQPAPVPSRPAPTMPSASQPSRRGGPAPAMGPSMNGGGDRRGASMPAVSTPTRQESRAGGSSGSGSRGGSSRSGNRPTPRGK